jgi:hypothetical protein
MPLWLNVPCYKLYFIGCMLPSRMRNYSVKSLYPRTERRTEDEKGRGDDAKGRTDEGKGRILLPTIAEARDMQKLQAVLEVVLRRSWASTSNVSRTWLRKEKIMEIKSSAPHSSFSPASQKSTTTSAMSSRNYRHT